MTTKNILGIFILVCNTAGIGFLLYQGGLAVFHHFFPKEAEPEETSQPIERQTVSIPDDNIPDDDDLLKDMDLSDLDNLNLDDFE